MKSLPLIFLAGVIAAGCGNSGAKATAKVPEVKEVKITAQNQRSLFPFAAGNTWTYVYEATSEAVNSQRRSATGILVYKVVKVSKAAANSLQATIDISLDGKKQGDQEWVVNDRGIFQISMKAGQPYSPMQPVIKFPASKEDSFKWSGTGLTPINKSGTMTYAFKNDGMQTVDTEMGPMTGLFMQSVGQFKTSDGIEGALGVNAWYSPGVGLVRYRQDIRNKNAASSIALRLKSYNVSK